MISKVLMNSKIEAMLRLVSMRNTNQSKTKYKHVENIRTFTDFIFLNNYIS